VDKDGDLENGIRVEMDKFDSVMIEESVEEVTSRNAESALQKGGEHHNLVSIGCWDVIPDGGAPLRYYAVREKMIHDELPYLTFIQDGSLKKVWM
jgi:hypothetical protein